MIKAYFIGILAIISLAIGITIWHVKIHPYSLLIEDTWTTADAPTQVSSKSKVFQLAKFFDSKVVLYVMEGALAEHPLSKPPSEQFKILKRVEIETQVSSESQKEIKLNSKIGTITISHETQAPILTMKLATGEELTLVRNPMLASPKADYK